MIVKAKNDAGTFDTKAYQFITNHRGDVLSIRDSEDKEVATYTYDAYGNELSATGTLAKANPIRYAAYYYDEETKNYYLQARYYNSVNGSFLALDPHPGDDDEPLLQNRYNYANGNPVMNVDPNGKKAWKNAWYNSKRFLVAAINAAIFITSSTFFGVIGGVLFTAGKKKLSKSKKLYLLKTLKETKK